MLVKKDVLVLNGQKLVQGMHTMSFEELEGKYAAPIKYSLKTRAKMKVKKIIKKMLRVIGGGGAESNTEYGLLLVFRV